MNHKQKLGYMALGAGVLAIGIIIGQVITPDIEAQSNGVFDEIQCTRLTVVDKQGDVAVLLATGEDGGLVLVYGKEDGGSAGMTTDEHGGLVLVYGKDGGGTRIGIGEHSGVVKVYGKDGGSAVIKTNEHGGRFDVYNNQGKPRAAMGIDEFGTGAVSTWD